MDLDQFILRIKASGDWTVESRGCKFSMRLPSAPDMSKIYFRHYDPIKKEIPQENMTSLYASFAKIALTGWDGVTAEMVMPGGKDSGPVPFTKEISDWWMDQDSSLSIDLGKEVETRHVERVSTRAEDAKNSDSASNIKDEKVKTRRSV